MLKESRPKFLFSIFLSQNRVGAQPSKFVLRFAALGLFLSPAKRVNPYLPPTSLQKSSAAALYMLYIDIKGLLKESRPKFLFLIFWSQNRTGAQLSKFVLVFAANGPFLPPTKRVNLYLPPTSLQKSSAATLVALS